MRPPIRYHATLAVALIVFLSCSVSHAQQELKDAKSGEVLGWHYSRQRGAPRVVILPGRQGDKDERMALAHRLLRLQCNVYVPAMTEAFYSQHIPADSLATLAKGAISQIYEWDRPPAILLIGAGKYASVALLTSLRDFRVKCAIALSPGEYFGDSYSVADTLTQLSVPVLALYRPEEQKMVRGVFKFTKRKPTIFSPTLRGSGYAALTESGVKGGEAWLAVSIFYNELFGE